jgi:MoaA/NifB/PqqE/SkfB family radical SAM enzyme
MKAEIAPRIDLENRTKLEEVIPLVTPFVVFVDPSDACNFKCKFCPTGDRDLMKSVNRPLTRMNFELFKKIADDMTNFPSKVKVLRLYKDGEPLINKELEKMVKYAKDIGASERIDTTTNASLLTKERGKALVDAGLDRINISIYGVSTENYKSFSDAKVEFSTILQNVQDFYEVRGNCEMVVKVNGDTLSNQEKEIFLQKFGNSTDKIFIEHTMACWPNFELRGGVEVNNEVGIYGQELTDIDACPYPFYSFSINSDGLVSVCFLDWGRKLTVGDVKSQSVQEIWDGKPMRSYRKMFLEGGRKGHPTCGGCGQMTHGQPDNIDPYKDVILKKLNDSNYFEGVPDLLPINKKSIPIIDLNK